MSVMGAVAAVMAVVAAPGVAAQSGISTSKPRLLLPDTPENKFMLAESPIWDEKSQRLHWVSLEGIMIVCNIYSSVSQSDAFHAFID